MSVSLEIIIKFFVLVNINIAKQLKEMAVDES